jgi:hypothetical protein
MRTQYEDTYMCPHMRHMHISVRTHICDTYMYVSSYSAPVVHSVLHSQLTGLVRQYDGL